MPTGWFTWWSERLFVKAIPHQIDETPFRERVIRVADPDGMPIGLVETTGVGKEQVWITRDIDRRRALRGLHGVTLSRTGAILLQVLGFARIEASDSITRFVALDGAGGLISLKQAEHANSGRLGAGTVRQIALRASNVDELTWMVEKLRSDCGIVSSNLEDRTYLRSVSFRSLCGALFELATDFEVDERLDALVSQLNLPSFLEPRRRELRAILPRLH